MSPIQVISDAISPPKNVQEFDLPVSPFDPAIHLDYKPPATRHSFTELGLPVPKGCPDICFVEPFQLFTAEGIRMIRREVFRKSFLDKFLRSWERAPCIIGGHANLEDEGKFISQTWHHPATQAAVNDAFGCPLSHQLGENDLGYINVQLGSEGLAGVYKLRETPSKPLPKSEKLPSSVYDDVPVDKWHKDMTPVTVVLMLSDTSTMVGGETAVKTGDGRVIKSRGTAIGGAIIIAGGYAEHAALRAENCPERLTMTACFSYADPNADDSATTLKSVNPRFDNMEDTLDTFMLQKVRRLRDRCDLALARIEERRANHEMVTKEEVEPWVKDQIQLLKHTCWEMFERVPNHLGREIPVHALEKYLEA
ncbi:unnamed protein product [Clonostachys solani]|uniref:Uncharacterized protein n=1 Tax=Clonostachys solani TaxID=160281 RepID=A0A9N9Z1F2_9HYPO|nr:unnamed protein product [Clonostachys solani]